MMKKFLSLIVGLAALALSSAAFAVGPCAGLANCNDNQIQGQLQGQAQGQAQGQGQGQQQDVNVGNGFANFSPNAKADADAYSKSSAYSGASAYGKQGQLQGNVGLGSGNKTSVNVKNDASGNAVAAFAPSLSTRSTTNCITTYAASGGGGGTGSIFSLGVTLPIRDEDCVQEQAVRTGFESNIPEAQQLALELYRHQMATIMEKEGHITAASVLDENGNVKKVAYSTELRAFVPIEKHPKFRLAAATMYARTLLDAGYTPNVSRIGGSGFQRVSFPTLEGSGYVDMDEDLIESVIGEIDDEGNTFQRVTASDRN